MVKSAKTNDPMAWLHMGAATWFATCWCPSEVAGVPLSVVGGAPDDLYLCSYATNSKIICLSNSRSVAPFRIAAETMEREEEHVPHIHYVHLIYMLSGLVAGDSAICGHLAIATIGFTT